MSKLTGLEPCTCGHALEEHGGGDPRYPGSEACTECDCIAYEADEQNSNRRPFKPRPREGTTVHGS